MQRRFLRLSLLAAIVALTISVSAASAGTVVPGQDGRWDADANGYPDAGVTVTGVYSAVYAEDAGGAYYWDLGDGRVYTSPGVDSVDDLDQATLDVCSYRVQYRGSFENDPYLDSGWIKNEVTCRGYSGTTHYTYVIVSKDDPRYTGNPDWAIWGTWELHVSVEGKAGNVVRPERGVGS